MIIKLLKSRTIQGILLTLLGAILRSFGVGITDETLTVVNQELINLYPEIMEVVGLAWASYGRIKASGPITFKKP